MAFKLNVAKYIPLKENYVVVLNLHTDEEFYFLKYGDGLLNRKKN